MICKVPLSYTLVCVLGSASWLASLCFTIDTLIAVNFQNTYENFRGFKDIVCMCFHK